ncbi:TlyA family RNA methyltransferase [Candidatus Saccharibacteria bacterium]|nr:TlyA family RNA methyltransferase [Candidatus Saccharibacteria bacterium]
MSKVRLDNIVLAKGLVISRSQAESFIKLGKVTVNNKIIKRAGTLVNLTDDIQLTVSEQYVSRAGLKLESVINKLALDFKNKVVLDVGSSTGGFTDYALRNGASKVIAVELGKNQLHASLLGNPLIELHEKTDIRNFSTTQSIDIVVADLSFISLREILPSIKRLANKNTQIVVMVKPQFEARNNKITHRGVIKNERIRRDILVDFEVWTKKQFVIQNKADSDIAGFKGNKERFYLLKVI